MEKTHIHPRRLARRMAKARLDREKITGYNREQIGPNGKKQPSVFARNWRSIAQDAISAVYPRKRARK